MTIRTLCTGTALPSTAGATYSGAPRTAAGLDLTTGHDRDHCRCVIRHHCETPDLLHPTF